MIQVEVHEAMATLPQLLDRVEAGERVVISRAGQPVAELIAVRQDPRAARRPLSDLAQVEASQSSLKGAEIIEDSRGVRRSHLMPSSPE